MKWLTNWLMLSENKNITITYEPILEEDHATILHKAVYAGFQKLNEKKKD